MTSMLVEVSTLVVTFSGVPEGAAMIHKGNNAFNYHCPCSLPAMRTWTANMVENGPVSTV